MLYRIDVVGIPYLDVFNRTYYFIGRKARNEIFDKMNIIEIFQILRRNISSGINDKINKKGLL